MEFTRETAFDFTVFVFASILALAIGFGYSGGIYIVSNMLQPSLAFIPAYIYSAITNTLFAISVVTWGALQYSGMKSLFKSKTESEEIEALVSSSTDTAVKLLIIQLITSGLRIQNTEDRKNQLKFKVLTSTIDNINIEIGQLNDKIEAQNNDSKLYTGYLVFLNYGLGSLYASLGLLQKNRRHSKLKIVLSALNNEQHSITSSSTFQIAATDKQAMLENSAAFVTESFNQILPQTLPTKFTELSSSITPFIMNIMTNLNALFINSIGLALYGGFSLISMLGTQAISSNIAILLAFGFVGYTGAMSFSRPEALNAVNVLFGYSDKATQGMKLNPENQENHGYFSASPRIQGFLAIFMAAGSAVGNYVANTAFGEVIFSGISIFAINDLMPILISSPFSASRYSIAFGMMAGICTFFIVASLLLNGTLSVTPKKDPPLRNLPNRYDYLHMLLKSAGCVAVFSTSAAILLSGNAFTGILLTHIHPIIIATMAVYTMYVNFKHCEENDSTFISNFFISTTVLVAALSSAYLNSLPGTVYFILFGPTITPFIALVIGIANLELGLAMFRNAKFNLNAMFNAPKPYVSKIFACTPSSLAKYSIDIVNVLIPENDKKTTPETT